MSSIHMEGLRKRPTYNELIEEIETDEKIKLPDRRATQIRDSPYMGFLYDNTFIEMEQQNERASKERQMREILNQQASASNGSVRESTATQYYELYSNDPPEVNVNESHGSLQQHEDILKHEEQVKAAKTKVEPEFVKEYVSSLFKKVRQSVKEEETRSYAKEYVSSLVEKVSQSIKEEQPKEEEKAKELKAVIVPEEGSVGAKKEAIETEEDKRIAKELKNKIKKELGLDLRNPANKNKLSEEANKILKDNPRKELILRLMFKEQANEEQSKAASSTPEMKHEPKGKAG